MVLAFLLSLLTPLPASAVVSKEACANVDYSPQLGINRDQDNSDWCWASSAADLVGFAQGYGPARQVSVIDMALTGMVATEKSLLKAAEGTGDWQAYAAARSEAPYLTESGPRKREQILYKRQGWSLTAAISYNSRARACLENQVPSSPPTPFVRERAHGPQPFVRQPGLDRTAPGTDPKVTPFGQRRRAGLSGDELSFIEAQLREYGDQSADLRGLDSIAKLSFACVREDAPVFQRYSTYFHEFNQLVLEKVAEEARKRCEGGPPVRPMVAEVEDFARGPASPAPAKISQWLDSGPVSVSLPSRLSFKDWKPDAPVKKWHEAVIAGRRWNAESGKCEFKLRQSYGPGCDRYAETFRKRCDGGNIWLTEEEVARHSRFAARVRAK